jgi:hypothetical protein
MIRTFMACALAAALLLPAARASAADRHAGYYYPEPKSQETYKARAQALPDASRERRLGFINAMTAQMIANPYPPPVAIFAKGEEAEKLIVVALQNGPLDTIFRARAVFAQYTASARSTDFFREHHVDDLFTFFDLAKLLGFTQITVSDGRSYAHRVLLQ